MDEQKTSSKRKAYPSDLSDLEFERIEALLPPPKRRGRKRSLDLREVVNAILYVLKTGVQWGYLPHDFPAKSSVYDYYSAWKEDGTWKQIAAVLLEEARVLEGRERTPSMAIVDAQSVQNTGALDEARGFDGGKKVRGRKRHFLVDTVGLILGVLVTVANVYDSQALPDMVAQASRDHGGLERLEVVLGDSAYQGQDEALRRVHPSARLEVVTREPGTKGFVVQPRRWVVERSISWVVQNRRLVRDHEFHADSAQAWLHIAAARHALRRISRISG